MNKYVTIGVVATLIITGGWLYFGQGKILPGTTPSMETAAQNGVSSGTSTNTSSSARANTSSYKNPVLGLTFSVPVGLTVTEEDHFRGNDPRSYFIRVANADSSYYARLIANSSVEGDMGPDYVAPTIATSTISINGVEATKSLEHYANTGSTYLVLSFIVHGDSYHFDFPYSSAQDRAYSDEIIRTLRFSVSSTQYKTITNAPLGISFQIPENWITEDHLGDAHRLWAEDPESLGKISDGYGFSLSASIDARDNTATVLYAPPVFSVLQSQEIGHHENKKVDGGFESDYTKLKNLTIDGNPAVLFMASGGKDFLYNYETLWVHGKNKEWYFTFEDAKYTEKYPYALPIMNAVLSSIHVEPEQSPISFDPRVESSFSLALGQSATDGNVAMQVTSIENLAGRNTVSLSLSSAGKTNTYSAPVGGFFSRGAKVSDMQFPDISSPTKSICVKVVSVAQDGISAVLNVMPDCNQG